MFTNQYCTHVEGFANWVSAPPGEWLNARGSHVAGTCATSKDKFCYVWSGVNNASCILEDESVSSADINYDYLAMPTSAYCSHGPGTFNINPISGIDGVFIGEYPFS